MQLENKFGEIKMVDLHGQYLKIKDEIDHAIQEVIDSSHFIKGKAVGLFESQLADYLGTKHVISCANGTDALQIALMALDLPEKSEIIVPAFSYAATVEVIFLLGFKPIYIDVNPDDFNINPNLLETLITEKTKAIIAVHLFGQQSNMIEIMKLANKHKLYVIEDNAQSIGSTNTTNNSKNLLGHIATTSFFPTKNLSCYGDGGAMYTDDKNLATKMRHIANHGQSEKYIHDIIGVNSRLDTIQAAVLNVKLKHLDAYVEKRKETAKLYHDQLNGIDNIILPKESNFSDHVYHQFTLRIKNDQRAGLMSYLKERNIPYAQYYKLPLHQQKAYESDDHIEGSLVESENLCNQVISLPIHTEIKKEAVEFIANNIKYYFNK